MLSKTAEHAMRALVHIASRATGEPVQAREVSAATAIPHNYLTKILNGLRRAGVLSASRGRRGGYLLARPAADLRLVDIVAVFDDLTRFVRCFVQNARCSGDERCVAHTRWRPVAATLLRFLNETTLEQLAPVDCARAVPEPAPERCPPMPTRELDVRRLPPEKHHPGTISDAFAALPESESLLLINDHDPKPLLYRFQVEHTGRFNWSVLEAGPERWRVEIQRRPASADLERGVAEYLRWDHARLDAVLETFRGHVRAGEWEPAAERFGVFRTGLERHIRMEEEVLFLVFEERARMEGRGPTVVMREEHAQIRATLADVGHETGRRSEPGVDRGVGALLSLLRMHNGKEEDVLYPLCDQALGRVAADHVVRQLQAL